MQTATTANMRVIYSTTDKAYLLLSGQTVTGKFPSREAAEVAHLEQEAPEALAIALSIAEAHPELRSRALRAVSRLLGSASRRRSMASLTVAPTL